MVTLGTNSNEIKIKIQHFSVKKMGLEMSSKMFFLCRGVNVTGGERTRVSADTLVNMADNILAHRTCLLWLSDFASIFSSCK